MANFATGMSELRGGDTRRIVLRSAFSGRQLSVSGESTLENGWTVRGCCTVGFILGELVHIVSDLGTIDAEEQRFRVEAVLTADGGDAPDDCVLRDCGAEEVQVVLGAVVVNPLPLKRPRATAGTRGSSSSASEPSPGSWLARTPLKRPRPAASSPES